MITHVAIRFNGVIYSLPKPNRHHDVIRHIVELTGVDTVDSHGDDQGFLDHTDKYLTRKQALHIAYISGQLRDDQPVLHNQLFSENLW